MSSDYDVLLQEAATYEEEWWLTDERVAEAARNVPGLARHLVSLSADRLISTKDVHHYPNDWNVPRQRLHGAIIDRLIATHSASSSSEPVAVLLLGIPGSGKSSILRRIVDEWGHPTRALVLDADDVRVSFPEYANGRGGNVVQDETADVTYGTYYSRILDEPAHLRPLLVIDTVGDPQYLPDTADRLRSRGWQVAALLSDVSVDLAVERARARACNTGRIVDERYLRSRDGVPREGLTSLLTGGLIGAGWAIVDTSGPPQDAPVITQGDGTFGANGAQCPFW